MLTWILELLARAGHSFKIRALEITSTPPEHGQKRSLTHQGDVKLLPSGEAVPVPRRRLVIRQAWPKRRSVFDSYGTHSPNAFLTPPENQNGVVKWPKRTLGE